MDRDRPLDGLRRAGTEPRLEDRLRRAAVLGGEADDELVDVVRAAPLYGRSANRGAAVHDPETVQLTEVPKRRAVPDPAAVRDGLALPRLAGEVAPDPGLALAEEPLDVALRSSPAAPGREGHRDNDAASRVDGHAEPARAGGPPEDVLEPTRRKDRRPHLLSRFAAHDGMVPAAPTAGVAARPAEPPAGCGCTRDHGRARRVSASGPAAMRQDGPGPGVRAVTAEETVGRTNDRDEAALDVIDVDGPVVGTPAWRPVPGGRPPRRLQRASLAAAAAVILVAGFAAGGLLSESAPSSSPVVPSAEAACRSIGTGSPSPAFRIAGAPGDEIGVRGLPGDPGLPIGETDPAWQLPAAEQSLTVETPRDLRLILATAVCAAEIEVEVAPAEAGADPRPNDRRVLLRTTLDPARHGYAFASPGEGDWVLGSSFATGMRPELKSVSARASSGSASAALRSRHRRRSPRRS
jgi:hypothetical protein